MGISISAATDLQLYFMVHWFKFFRMLILSNQQSKTKDPFIIRINDKEKYYIIHEAGTSKYKLKHPPLPQNNDI